MQRVNKPVTSEILKKKLIYKVGGNNSKLAKALCDEQHNICAYTETYLGRSDKKDVDHFNPTLKGSQEKLTKGLLIGDYQLLSTAAQFITSAPLKKNYR
jgi:hypothetical protein